MGRDSLYWLASSSALVPDGAQRISTCVPSTGTLMTERPSQQAYTVTFRVPLVSPKTASHAESGLMVAKGFLLWTHARFPRRRRGCRDGSSKMSIQQYPWVNAIFSPLAGTWARVLLSWSGKGSPCLDQDRPNVASSQSSPDDSLEGHHEVLTNSQGCSTGQRMSTTTKRPPSVDSHGVAVWPVMVSSTWTSPGFGHSFKVIDTQRLQEDHAILVSEGTLWGGSQL